jgi:hypothetical protein
MYQEKIVNLQTGEEAWRNFSADEIAEIEQEQIRLAAEAAEAAAKEAARQDLLDKLGITADEAKLLLG